MAQKQKKELEIFYASMFLRKVGWSYALEPREAPDFLMRTPGAVIGLEVTQLYKDERADGSPQKEAENQKVRYLRSLAKAYYAMGGKPLYVIADLSLWDLDEKLIPHIARRLVRRRPTSDLGHAEFEVKTAHYLKIAKLSLISLKAPSNYSGWICVNNSTGLVRPVEDELLTRKIEEKAEKLPEYRMAAKQTMLLIVAESTQESGMFSYTPRQALLPSHGFSEVHLFIHPMETWRIA
jgi:hypothetical protein